MIERSKGTWAKQRDQVLKIKTEVKKTQFLVNSKMPKEGKYSTHVISNLCYIA